MKHFSLFALGLGLAFHAAAQTPLDVSTYLIDSFGPVQGVQVDYSTQAAGAVISASAVTDANGVASAVLDLPAGTMQGILAASYLDCDSLWITMETPYSVNVIGGLGPVVLTGIYCSGDTTGGTDCTFVLDGGLTFAGSYQYMVSNVPEDAEVWWSINGAVTGDMGTTSPGWFFDAETVNVVCVDLISATCGTWSDCITVDLTTGGGVDPACAIAFEFGQTLSPAGEPMPGSVDVWLSQGEDADSYLWDFGDEGYSQEMTPTHTYNGNGPYLLCVTAIWNDSIACTAQFCDTLSVDEAGIVNFLEGFTINVYANENAVSVAELVELEAPVLFPNPALGGAVQWSAPAGITVEAVEAINLVGARIAAFEGLNIERGQLDISGWAPGHYVIQFKTNRGNHAQLLWVE
jgi:hypothetical protein